MPVARSSISSPERSEASEGEMRHYLDHASTSPARPEVVEAMIPWLANAADPGRVHTEGRVVRGAVEAARENLVIGLT